MIKKYRVVLEPWLDTPPTQLGRRILLKKNNFKLQPPLGGFLLG